MFCWRIPKIVNLQNIRMFGKDNKNWERLFKEIDKKKAEAIREIDEKKNESINDLYELHDNLYNNLYDADVYDADLYDDINELSRIYLRKFPEDNITSERNPREYFDDVKFEDF